MTASAAAAPASGLSSRMSAASGASITRDQCIETPGGSSRCCARSNQAWPAIRSRTSTNRIASSVDMASNTPSLMTGTASVQATTAHSKAIMILGFAAIAAAGTELSAAAGKSDMRTSRPV